MILFFKKDTGEVFSTIGGRVHNEQQMKCGISDGTPKKNIGKFIIGWEEKNGEKIEHNMDNFESLLQFEDKESPLDYKIIKGKLT